MTMLQPYIAQNLNATIWRMEIDELTNNLVAEVRNEQDKQASFASINLLAGVVNFTGYTTPERWLTGIEAVYDNVLLLHHYRHQSGPEHKAIIAIDATTQAELWSNYSVAFDHLSINGPLIYDTAFQTKKLMLADIKTGKISRPYNLLSDKHLQNSIIVPSVTTADKFTPGLLPSEAYGNIVHYLNHGGRRIVSLHTQKNGSLQQVLYIMNGVEVVYQDILNTDIQKLQPEAFVLHKNALIYIKEKTEIKAINL